MNTDNSVVMAKGEGRAWAEVGKGEGDGDEDIYNCVNNKNKV